MWRIPSNQALTQLHGSGRLLLYQRDANNGYWEKMDRRRLRDIGSAFSIQQLAGTQTQETKRKPGTHIERQLQRIWGQTLEHSARRYRA